MENRLYRPLLPRTGPNRDAPVLTSQRKRKRASIACDTCRERKRKCDGGRPVCSSCQSRDETCSYITKDEMETRQDAIRRENGSLKERNVVLEALVRQLRLLPESDAHGLLEQIRTTPNTDPLLMLNAARGHRHVAQPSAEKTALPLIPWTQSRVELVLSTRHPVAYPNLSLLEPSIDFESTTQGYWLPDIAPPPPYGPAPRNSPEFDLEDLSIGFWTAVPVSDEYARGAISLYLEIDHPTIGTFDAQLFIDGLLRFRFDYCSPFLVCALLAFASQGYATRDSSASARSLEFEREAEKLLEVENVDSLPTLSGLALLSYSHGAHGQYSDGSRKYAEKVLQMGRRMRLFGTPDTLRHDEVQALTAAHQHALAAAAWGGFNTIMLLSLFYVLAPSAHPPTLAYPERSGMVESNAESAESFSSRPPTCNSVRSLLCSVWTVVSEVLCIYRDPEPPGAATLAFAYSKYARLLALSEELPSYMSRNKHTSLHALFFHIVYHTAILEVFRPLLSSKKVRIASSLAASTPSPETIFAASVQQLKGLVTQCIQRQGAAATVFWAGIGLMQVANTVLKSPTSSDWRYYFLFCVRSFQLLFPAFAVCKGIVQGLLAMAVENRLIAPSEAVLIMEEFSRGGNFHGAIVRSRGGFVVDYDLALRDRQLAGVDTWVERYQEIDAFSTFTNEQR